MRVDKELGKIRKKFASGNVLTGVAQFNNVVRPHRHSPACCLLSTTAERPGFIASVVAPTGAAVCEACLSGMGHACLRPYTDSCMQHVTITNFADNGLGLGGTWFEQSYIQLQSMTRRSMSGSCSTSTCWATMWSLATSRQQTSYLSTSECCAHCT